VVKDGHKRGQQRWRCRGCERTFGPTVGTPLYRLHTPAAEVARSLLVVMRRGSLTAAEEITGHQYETIGTWLRRAGDHAAALTEALVQDLHLSEVEVDAFWSFVHRSASRLGSGPRPVRPGWAHAGAA
jgi:transposase-like protein